MFRFNQTLKMGLCVGIALSMTACGDLVIKVDKKSKSQDEHTLSSIDSQRTNGAVENAADFLKDMDNLRAVAVELLLQQLDGQDFRQVLRESIRKYRAELIKQSQSSIKGSLLDASAISCDEGKLDLNLAEANKYLGVIMKSAVLAKLSDASAAAMNSKLATEASAISRLLLKEIGLKVEGDSIVTNKDGQTVTSGDLSISLTPFDTDDAETQAKDASETININFTRSVGEKRTGTFDAVISVTQMINKELVETNELKLIANRTFKDGLSTHETAMSIGKKGSIADFSRSTVFQEVEPMVVRVVDSISHKGNETKTTASILDLNEAGKCVINKDKIDNTDHTKVDHLLPNSKITNTDVKDTEDKVIVITDEDEVLPFGGNANQSPSQS